MQPQDQYRECVRALKAYVQDAGFSEVVLGLSGGMDSSVVAVMCADAFGAHCVHGVLLPGPYSSEHSISDALQLAQNVGIETQTVSICEPYRAFANVLTGQRTGTLEGLAAQNTQARCRMVCLMALSNANGWLLVNTGNKSEAMMGYSTLYGDMAGAFAPLGGLYKTEVNTLARWRNKQGQAAGLISPIPENVFVKPPSAELAPNQEDEKSLGIDYATLDAILIAYVEQGCSAQDLARRGFERAAIKRVLSTVEATAFKRAYEPPCPRVSFYA